VIDRLVVQQKSGTITFNSDGTRGMNTTANSNANSTTTPTASPTANTNTKASK